MQRIILTKLIWMAIPVSSLQGHFKSPSRRGSVQRSGVPSLPSLASVFRARIQGTTEKTLHAIAESSSKRLLSQCKSQRACRHPPGDNLIATISKQRPAVELAAQQCTFLSACLPRRQRLRRYKLFHPPATSYICPQYSPSAPLVV